MRAVLSRRYGLPDVLEIGEAPKPEHGAGELLVRVHASTVTRTDDGMLRAKPFIVRFFMGLRRPRRTILGMDFAGVVEGVGEGVRSFKPGDRVFGISPDDFGCHAEYVCIPEAGGVAQMPEGLDFSEAVVCEGAWYADCYLRALPLKPGDSILVYGASGAIGTSAVQLAKASGAEVTAVTSTPHLELVRSLGADHVVDYTAGDFTRIGQTFDCILDAVGKTTYFRCRKLLKPNGVYAATDLGPWLQNPLLALWSGLTRSRRVLFPLPKDAASFVPRLRQLLVAGFFRAVIDQTYPLEEIADAYRYVETGQKAGIVVVTVAGGSSGP